jgi:hypothetical protein
MATDVLLVREKNGFAAADPTSAEVIQGMKHGEVVTATIRRTRNPRFHRLFWALLNLVFENQDRYTTLEQLLDAVKLNIGYFDLVTIPGKVPTQICKLRSISFAKMDETSFRQFFDKAVVFIVADVVPGIDRADLERQVLEIVGSD